MPKTNTGAAPRKRGEPQNTHSLPASLEHQSPSVNPVLVAAINDLSTAIAKVFVAAAAPAQSDWISQRGSPLGPVRHCAAVRRRIDADEGGAALVGRTCLLSPDALQAELSAQSHRRVIKAKSFSSVTAELDAALRAVGSDR